MFRFLLKVHDKLIGENLFLTSLTYLKSSVDEFINLASIFYRGRAPIASMDAMEELDAGLDILTGSNPALQPDCHILGKGVLPGLRYRHLGKSGLKVNNNGSQHFYLFLLSFFVFSFVDRGWPRFWLLLSKYL